MLRLEAIDAGYDGTRVLWDVGIEAKADATTVIVGPNGAGKSTVLNVVTGLLRPSGGHVLFKGEDIMADPSRDAGSTESAPSPCATAPPALNPLNMSAAIASNEAAGRRQTEKQKPEKPDRHAWRRIGVRGTQSHGREQNRRETGFEQQGVPLK